MDPDWGFKRDLSLVGVWTLEARNCEVRTNENFDTVDYGGVDFDGLADVGICRRRM